jgi:two-component system, OmpR family, sensor histidine kinase BaeS
MSLRLRLVVAFALVAIGTAAAVSLAAPGIVGRGFAQMQAGPGPGGHGMGPMTGMHVRQVQEETTLTIVGVALGAALVASLLGIVLASSVARPLRRLETAAGGLARGDLQRRSGLADRSDEFGALGRSFDTMAGELERTDDLRRRFFQDAVHELKTPLAVIDATTSAVLDGVYQHEDRHLETIRSQSRLLTRIVDDLRTISLAEAGALPLHPEPVPVDRLLADATADFAARADRAGVRLATTHVPPGLTVVVDSDRLRQVLGALLDNAIRHTPAGGEIVLEAERRSTGTRLVVRDGGPGVRPEDVPHLFDRFYQADPARDRSTGTSGLGLAIVKAIVDAHGGAVGVDTAPAGGARFWIDLPVPGG